MRPQFADRAEAGRRLAEQVVALKLSKPLVLALPRGGVPVAAVVARALNAPLDLLLVRKIGVPWQPELAAAAVVDGDPPEIVTNHSVMAHAGLQLDYIQSQAQLEMTEIERRRQLYLGGREALPVAGHELVVIDDGVATGTSMLAALEALQRRAPLSVIVALPVAPRDALERLRSKVQHLICLSEPDPFWAVGAHYVDFHQVSDQEVQDAMAASRAS